MDANDVINKFSELFAGRTDAFGTEEGGCIRLLHDPISSLYAAHLHGAGLPIGIYPVVGTRLHISDGSHQDSFCVKWGACDIDYDDLQEALNFHDLLLTASVPSYIERSRSKGYHVWVFVEDWISAETMRHALLVVRDFLKMQAREIYPKQTTLRDGELGNYLRLPYPGALDPNWTVPERRVMLDAITGQPLSLSEFFARLHYASPAQLEKLAAKYTPPRVTPVHVEDFDRDDTVLAAISKQALRRIDSALVYHIANHGPLSGGDRSSTLMRLCNMVKDKGATSEEAFAIIWTADCKDWGRKYVDRHDGEYQIRALVERVYGSDPF